MKHLKKIFFSTLFLFICSISSFSQETNPNGFLANVRELKEISDIMDIVSANFVGVNDKVIVDKRKLMQGTIKGMVESLGDPYSNYFTKTEMENFVNDIKGTYVGVGMIIQKKKDEPLTVVSPIEDSPAYKLGIKPRDQILSIDGEATYNMSTEESSKKLRGTPNTSVKVTVYRETTKETKEITIVRSPISLKYVKHDMIDNEDKIGYLRLTQFGDAVYPDVKKAMDDLKNKNMQALVLDLRSNPGGSLDQAIKIASMFIKDGKIVSTKAKDGHEEVALRQGEFYGDFPMTVLINAGSASASEIVAGAIKDHKRGLLIGEKSFGKGSVQTLIPLPDGDGIKLTIAKYFTPSGICIHGIGIEPDIKVEEKENYMLFGGMGTVINIDEDSAKENRRELIKDIKGEKTAEEFEKHKDVQLETAINKLKEELKHQPSNNKTAA